MSTDDIPPLCQVESSEDEANENDDDAEEGGWMELETNDTTTICLFCVKDFRNTMNDGPSLAIEHMKTVHAFDLAAMKAKFCMDQYSFIKMVNYIRTHHIIDAKLFTSTVTSFWEDPAYLKPVEFESWLMYDFDNLEVPHNAAAAIKSPDQIIKELCFQLMEKDALLERATQDIQRLQESFRKTFDSQLEPPPIKRNHVGAISAFMDEGYFSTYAHYEIHYDMLSDKVRTDSYRDAISQNSDVIRDKVVLDLGCGTSILSMFASRAGAKQVISVDQSDIIYHAMDIVRKNNIENIVFVKGRIEDTPLPIQERVDIIISEWMGYFLLFEGMLDSVIYARDNHLSSGGLLFPNRCTLSLVAFGDEARHRQYIEFWQNVYGFDMSCLQTEVLREAVVETCNPQHVLTGANVIAEFDLMAVTVDCVNFSYDFSLAVTKSGRITSFVGYFDTMFELPNPIAFSTSPDSTPTHWKQVLFYLKSPVAVIVGETISGKIICRRNHKDLRALVVKIEVFGDTLQYNLN